MLYGKGVGKLFVARLREGLDQSLRNRAPGQGVQLAGHRVDVELRDRQPTVHFTAVGHRVLRDPGLRGVLQPLPDLRSEQSTIDLDGDLRVEGGKDGPPVRLRAGTVLADRQCKVVGSTVPVPFGERC